MASRRAGAALLAAALLLAVVSAAHDFTAPWENGMRGENAAAYEDVFVQSFLRWGLGVTHAAPAMVIEHDGVPTCYWHWHHPPLYPLWLAAVARVLGHYEWTLRLGHLWLFLPGIAGLWALVRRWLGPVPAGLAALLFAATPMVGYFGPMVVHDGAVLAFGLLTAASFWRWVEAPTRRRWGATAALFFVATLLDFLGHLWGIALFLLALAAPRPRQAVAGVLALLPVSLLSLLLVALHYGTFLGGPMGFVTGILRVRDHATETGVTAAQLGDAAAAVLFEYGAWPIYALALLGIAAVSADRDRKRRRLLWLALALATPGALSCALFLPHAVGHPFWSMPVMAGVAVAASAVPASGLRWWRAGSRAGGWRAAGAAALLLAAGVVVHGAVATRLLVERFRAVDTGFQALIAEAAGLAGGCDVALTNRTVAIRPFLPGLMFLGGVDTAEKLDFWIAYGRNIAFPGEVAFLLDRSSADAGLVARLDQLARPQALSRVTLYRFRL